MEYTTTKQHLQQLKYLHWLMAEMGYKYESENIKLEESLEVLEQIDKIFKAIKG